MTPEGWYEAFQASRARTDAPRRGVVRTIYCLTEGYGMPVKIGIASNLRERILAGKTYSWRQLFLAWQMPGSAAHEAALHHALGEDCLGGEWFNDPLDFAKRLIERPDASNLPEMIGRIGMSRGVPPIAKRRRDRVPFVIPTLDAAVGKSATGTAA